MISAEEREQITRAMFDVLEPFLVPPVVPADADTAGSTFPVLGVPGPPNGALHGLRPIHDLVELDQAPDAEARTVGRMFDQLHAIRRRYPAGHDVGVALDALIWECKQVLHAYVPFKTPSFEVR